MLEALPTTTKLPGVHSINASVHDRRSIAIVLSLTALYLAAACVWQGISFYDDSVYLTIGLTLHPNAFKYGVFWGPLYGLWIRMVSLLVHDRVWCYMASWALLVAGCSSVPLWFRKPWAWAFTLALVAVPFFNVGPYVSLFVGTILLTGLCIVLRLRCRLPVAVFVACMACFLASLCRAEFAYAVYISATATVLLSFVHARTGPPRTAAAMAAAAIIAAFFIHYSQSHSGNERPALAFVQHFNYRAAEAGVLKGVNPWTSTYAEHQFGVPLKDPITGHAPSISDYYRANPVLFRAHVAANLGTPRLWLLLLALLPEVFIPWIWGRYRHLRAASVYLLLVGMPVAGTMAVIYPRPHYAVNLVPVLLAMVLALLHCHVSFSAPPVWLAVTAGACCILAQVPLRQNPPDGWDSSLRANVVLVRCIQRAEATVGAGNGLILNTGMPEFADVYFRLRHQRVEVPEVAVPAGVSGDAATDALFREWLQTKQPSWIVAGPELARSVRQQPEAIAQTLQRDFRYVVWPCTARVDTRIYVHP